MHVQEKENRSNDKTSQKAHISFYQLLVSLIKLAKFSVRFKFFHKLKEKGLASLVY